MALPTLTGIARLTKDSQVRETSTGKSFLYVRLAFNSKRKNRETGAWENGDTLFIDGSYWGKDHTDLAGELKRGVEVRATGQPRTRLFKNAEGENRETVEMNLRVLSPMVRTSRERRRKERDEREAALAQEAEESNEVVPF